MPRVRLFADDVVIHRTEGLYSRYETQRLPLVALSFEDAFGTPLPDDGDSIEEQRARRLLESFGAVPLECLDEWAPSQPADYVVRCEGNVHDFCTFGAHVVPQLRALGWRIDVDEKYPFGVLDHDPPWYAHVEPSGERPDWFGLDLGIEVDGKRASLLPALLSLLEQVNCDAGLGAIMHNTSKCLALPVGDGRFLAVPSDRARAILRVLAELYDGQPQQKTTVEFPKVRVPALLSLEETFEAGGGRLTLGDAPRAWAKALAARTACEPPRGLQATLRPYQSEGVAWLQGLGASGVGGILADDMGLGKTLQTICHLLIEKEQGRLAKPALIVAPTSLVPNWEREFGKFAPSIRVAVFHGEDRHSRRGAMDLCDVVVTSYPILCRDEDTFAGRPFSWVVLDEAQTIKNFRSRAHAAVRSVDTDNRVCLSGTPVENHLGELWALFDFANPGLLGDELHFNRFYRVPIEKGKNEERLAALRDVVAPYILRRNKRDVAKELPPKTEVMRPIELRGDQRELYESIRVAAHAEVRQLIRKRGLAASTVPILGALTKLRQVCCDPRLLRIGSARGVRESAKYAMFFDLLNTQLRGGHRILVFSQFTSMLALLARGLDERAVRYAMLTGDTKDRQAEVDRFERGACEVFLISLKAGGTGLTLTSADVVVHYDPWWNPAVQAQATDRAYRIGQHRPVMSYQLFVAGSVEERILGLQRSKQNVADAILERAAVGSSLTETEVDVLFAPLGA